MLKLFEVTGFRAFNERITLDLTSREYAYNSGLIAHGIVKNALVYGRNGSGKSSLGYALFDIVATLTDKDWATKIVDSAYCNLENSSLIAKFKYEFDFDGRNVVYEYSKRDRFSLVWEKLTIDGKVVVDWDFENGKHVVDLGDAISLKVVLSDNKLSVVKYLSRNLPSRAIRELDELMDFAQRMLWYRSLSDGHSYIGFTNGREMLVDEIYRQQKLQEFSGFLKQNGLFYDLDFEIVNGRPALMAYFFKRQRKINFERIESTGTKTLLLFFYWKIKALDAASLVFIDEFDAFFHFETAAEILGALNGMKCQTMVTSHNTYLMSNKFTRPDCCYIINQNRISPLCDCTDKEIRLAHNLEKMYINGAFSNG